MAKRQRTTVDRLPPHSEEAERGALGCVLLSPDCLAVCIDRFASRADVFYDLRNQHVFQAMMDLRRAAITIDSISVIGRLKEEALLEQCGGVKYITAELPDAVPSVANLGYYLDVIVEKYRQRKLISTCTDIVGRIYDASGAGVDALLRDAERDLFRHKTETLSDAVSWSQLLEFDTDNDPNNIVGIRNSKTTRYLCRGYGAWIIGSSGLGKSSLHFQMGICFCLGRPFFGVAPMRPLRVIVIQAENDLGDVSEMAKGICDGLHIDAFEDDGEAFTRLNENLKVVSVSGKLGLEFCEWMEREITAFKADIVFVDPLLSFAGVDVGRTEQASQLCRVWIDPVLRRTGAVLISVHHKGKPKEKTRNAGPASIYDRMYDGLGSSELVNWARAVMLLDSLGDDGPFTLTFAKRGRRAWATHPNDEPTQTVWLRHAINGGIFWEQIEPPEPVVVEPKKAGPKSKVAALAASNLSEVLSVCPKDGESANSIGKRFHKFSRKIGKTLGETKCRTDLLDLLVENGKLSFSDTSDLYFKGPNA